MTLKEAGFWPEREFEIKEGGAVYQVDLAIPCREGMVAISVSDRAAPAQTLHQPDPEAIRRAVEVLGGEQPLPELDK